MNPTMVLVKPYFDLSLFLPFFFFKAILLQFKPPHIQLEFRNTVYLRMNNPRNLALAGAGVAAALYLLPGNVLNTPATKSIGDAWSRGGGARDHTPAIATTRGNADKTESNQLNPTGSSFLYLHPWMKTNKFG
jgi:hypothetical protein